MPINGSRHLPNWIDAFVAQTVNTDCPSIFRRWTAISLLGAVLEQKVWIQTSKAMYPNIYTFIIAHPGVGKSRIIAEARELFIQLPDSHLAPISLTFAALVDSLEEAKRAIIRQPEGEIAYNSIFICADEMGAFIHKYEPEMIDGLSAFYYCFPYQQRRRGREKTSKIDRPQVNMIAGSTPANLIGFMPEKAWGQGFTSRIVMVFSDERILGDDFADKVDSKKDELLHDLKLINSLYGQFIVTKAYADAVNQWLRIGAPPIPEHPKLVHYITRRKEHIYKLSMVSSINKSSSLVITEEDFFQACEWLFAAEHNMPDIFKAGTINADSAAMDEIQHFIRTMDQGTGISEQRIVGFARERIPLTSILRIIEIMEGSGMIYQRRIDRKTGARFFSAATIVSSPPADPRISSQPSTVEPPTHD